MRPPLLIINYPNSSDVPTCIGMALNSDVIARTLVGRYLLQTYISTKQLPTTGS